MSRHSDSDGCLILLGIFILLGIISAIKNNPIFLVYIIISISVIAGIYYLYKFLKTTINENVASTNRIQQLEKNISSINTEKKNIEYELKFELRNELKVLENKIVEMEAIYNKLRIESKILNSSNLFFEEEFNEVQKAKLQTDALYKNLKIRVEDKDEFIKSLVLQLLQKDISIDYFLQKHYDNEFFRNISEIKTDYILAEFVATEEFFKTKKHPAYKKASDIKELRLKTKTLVNDYNILKYKYELIFTLFPELEGYFENLSDILDTKSYTIEELKKDYDYVRDYLSKEEYYNLTESERNQLALDRYVERYKKTAWQIGRDYEIMVGQLFEKEGFKVEYFGSEKKLNDLGRDLIAHKNNTTLVIQCKRWSEKRPIREKHIAQIFGTTNMYGFEIETEAKNKLIKPVMITTTELSETARKFSEKLGVIVRKVEFKEFPRIKCNISSSGEKIYHLPFDQQYDRTKINKIGEFYATTVEEAEEKGFRRAMKYYLRP